MQSVFVVFVFCSSLDWMDWTGLDWTGLDWTGLDWSGLDWSVLQKNCSWLILFCACVKPKNVSYTNLISDKNVQCTVWTDTHIRELTMLNNKMSRAPTAVS